MAENSSATPKSINMDEGRQPANEVASSAYNLSRVRRSTASAEKTATSGNDDEVENESSSSSFVSVSDNTRHWQTSKKTIKERVEFMFNNEHLADVFFIVGKGSSAQRIPAHKFVLSVSSAVFDAMFNSVLGADSDEIELPDVEPAAFFALLRCVNQPIYSYQYYDRNSRIVIIIYICIKQRVICKKFP